MNNLTDQTITLAAICQASYFVQKISRSGQLDDAQLEILLNSIMVTSPENTLEVYGNNVANLQQGLTTLIEHLGNQSKQKDPELTRYVVNLLSLQHRLAKKPKQLSALGERITQCQRQLAHYSITSETLVASIASIYSDIISPLGTPIQIAGEPSILKQPNNQHKIRALLLSGIRSAVLWRQVGGKRRTIIFSRSKLVAEAQRLLNQIT